MLEIEKPYSEACEQNKVPILSVLQEIFNQPGTILEIGSGTGQHAVYFARQLPHLIWQPTDLAEHIPGIKLWLAEANLSNVRQPRVLEVAHKPWPVERADGVFSANTTHIMSWVEVENMFQEIGKILVAQKCFCLYGPFNYGGHYTSASNAQFDAWLKGRNPRSGIRDTDDLNRLAKQAGLILVQDYPMPVNNRTLIWRKT